MASQGDSGAQVSTGKAKKGPIRRARRWLSTEKPLAHALVVVVVFGLIVAFIAWVLVSWILGQGLPWTSATEDTSRLDVTKLALTVVGGAGAFVALTVAYRRQKDLEDGRFTERFGAAASQLAAATPAERLAGVYAMAGVADRYPAFAQQCIDVLCGYLRLPFDPDPAVSHLTSVVRHHRLSADGDRTVDRTYQLLPNDREVRDTIVRVIAAHVHKDRELGWHAQDFDLTGAVLTSAEFRGAEFRGSLDCERATFMVPAIFNEARFTSTTTFRGARFTAGARFNSATFTGATQLFEATFEGDIRFTGATFNGDARFDASLFIGSSWFSDASFNGHTWFDDTTFIGDVRFDNATFIGSTFFRGASFDRFAGFAYATFAADARFRGATFIGDALFRGTTCSGQFERRDGTIRTSTEQPVGAALGFPDPEPDDESEDESG